MIIEGEINRVNGYYVASIPLFNISASSSFKQEALLNLINLTESKFTIDVSNINYASLDHDSFFIYADAKILTPLILKGLRNAHNLSIKDVTERLGFKGRSSYFKYESGERAMSLDSFDKMVTAITGKPIQFKI